MDDRALMRYLVLLLSAHDWRSRSARRRLLAAGMRPRPTRIWGGRQVPYGIWWGSLLLGTLVAPGVTAAVYNLRGHPMPAGIWNLAPFVVVLVGGPVFSAVQRRRELRRRVRVIRSSADAGLNNLETTPPQAFWEAARAALANAYGLPVELVDPADTRQEYRALVLDGEPLAVEVVAEIFQRLNIETNLAQLRAIGDQIGSYDACNVKDLVRTIYFHFRELGLVT